MRTKKQLHRKKYLLLTLAGCVFLLLLFLFYTFLIKKPTNKNVWETGFEKETQIRIKNNEVTFNNFRDFRFTKGKIISFAYTERKVQLSDIEKVWFIQEPFTVKPFTFFNGVAHTYFVFDVRNAEPVAVSVEARREKNEQYGAFIGMFNTFELSYIWGSEKDLTGQRIFNDNNTLYMFPLNLSSVATQKLFLSMIARTNDLARYPRFYNTLTSNCTNELAKSANDAKPGTIPFDTALFFPGYSDRLLYRLKLIPSDQSLDQIRKKYYISTLALEAYKHKNFSEKLREGLE